MLRLTEPIASSSSPPSPPSPARARAVMASGLLNAYKVADYRPAPRGGQAQSRPGPRTRARGPLRAKRRRAVALRITPMKAADERAGGCDASRCDDGAAPFVPERVGE